MYQENLAKTRFMALALKTHSPGCIYPFKKQYAVDVYFSLDIKPRNDGDCCFMWCAGFLMMLPVSVFKLSVIIIMYIDLYNFFQIFVIIENIISYHPRL